MKVYNGLLCLHSEEEADEILFLSSVEYALAKELEYLHNKNVTLRYWISNQELDENKIIDITAKMSVGILESEYMHRYSEYTGYLWTDEELNIGGHDLLEELKDNVGKWLYMEIETNDPRS